MFKNLQNLDTVDHIICPNDGELMINEPDVHICAECGYSEER